MIWLDRNRPERTLAANLTLHGLAQQQVVLEVAREVFAAAGLDSSLVTRATADELLEGMAWPLDAAELMERIEARLCEEREALAESLQVEGRAA